MKTYSTYTNKNIEEAKINAQSIMFFISISGYKKIINIT